MGAGGALAAAAAAQREAGARFEENGRWSGLGLEPEKKAVAGVGPAGGRRTRA